MNTLKIIKTGERKKKKPSSKPTEFCLYVYYSEDDSSIESEPFLFLESDFK